MAWCRVSSLTAAVARTLKEARFPMNRGQVLTLAKGKVVEGWEVDYFLSKALKKRHYRELRGVMGDLEGWLSAQG